MSDTKAALAGLQQHVFPEVSVQRRGDRQVTDDVREEISIVIRFHGVSWYNRLFGSVAYLLALGS